MVLKVKKGILKIFLLVVVGFIICILIDQAFAIEMTEAENIDLRKFAGLITDSALGIYWILLSILMILFYSLRARYPLAQETKFKYENLRSWAAHLLLSIVTTGLVVILLKFIIGRERPFINNGQVIWSFSPFSLNAIYQSFPSGHTQVIFCVASMLTCLWPKKRISFALFATVIALTRALTVNHYLSDIYVGALIGYFGSQMSMDLFSSFIQKPNALLQTCNQSSGKITFL